MKEKYTRLVFLAFSSEKRFAVSLNKDVRTNRLYFSGAPESILEMSNRVWHDGKMVSLEEDVRKRFIQAQKDQSKRGMRVTAVAFKNTKHEQIEQKNGVIVEKLSEELVFVGLLVFGDPIRKDVPSAIANAVSAGARVIMATGDNPETAYTIALEAGIADDPSGRALIGSDIDKLSDKELFILLKKSLSLLAFYLLRSLGL